MKKFLLGTMVFFAGFCFLFFIFVYSIINPGIYNYIGGLLGSLLHNGLLSVFLVSLAITAIGLVICAKEANNK